MIEVAVAIAVMAILAGAAIPLVMKTLNQQREQRARSEMKLLFEGLFGARDRVVSNMRSDFGYTGAGALSQAFNCKVNALPLSLILSWYEQKAVCILLSLLYLGIKNIRLGPSLPAFVTPTVLKVLVDKFNLMPITTPQKDLKAILDK